MTDEIKGYVYITGTGADPAARQNLHDPLFSNTPTLAACMPNIRRLVERGDYIFVISGKVPGIQQYVIGGMRVAEKISAIAAYKRFPENRLHIDEQGKLQGNIPIDSRGRKHPFDHHDAATFADRVKNFIVGDNAVAIKTAKEVELARAQSLAKMSQILDRRGNRMIDVVSRWKRLNQDQVKETIDWLKGIKASASQPK